jgi:hypothetical protein
MNKKKARMNCITDVNHVDMFFVPRLLSYKSRMADTTR